MTNFSIASGIAGVMGAALATGLFVSLVNIYQPSGTLTASGAPDGVYVPVSGLQGIRAMNAPVSVDSYNINSTSQNAVAQVQSIELRHVLLERWYPELSPTTNWGNTGWICEVDGVRHDILAAEQDSQLQMTRLRLQKAGV